MTRSILENVSAFDFHARVGLRYGTVQQTLTGNYAMAADQPVVLNFDCNGTNRNIVLPSITNGTGIDGRVHILQNVGTAGIGTAVTHADDSSLTLVAIEPGSSVTLIASVPKLTWQVNESASGGGGQGAPVKNTAITTVGAGTLTGAAIVGGVITRSGPVAAFTDTTDTAANVLASLVPAVIGDSWLLTVKNTTPFTETLAGGTGVTLSGQTIIPGNSVGWFLVTMASATTVTIQGLAVVPMTTTTLEASTALTTVGAGTITGAGIAGGVTNRTGSTAAFTDTTDTAANIIAAEPNANIGQSWEYTYYNNTLGTATISGGTGVTVTLASLVPPGMWARYLVTYTAAATVTMVGIAMGPVSALQQTQFVTKSSGNGTLAAGDMEGANQCFLASSGATAFTTRTAAQLLAQIPNGVIGQTWFLRVYNTNAGTLTLTGGTGVTITGTATIATNITRDYAVTITGAAAVTMQNVGSGVAN